MNTLNPIYGTCCHISNSERMQREELLRKIFSGTDEIEVYASAEELAARRRGDPTLLSPADIKSFVSKMLIFNSDRARDNLPKIHLICIGDCKLTQQDIVNAVAKVDKNREITDYLRGTGLFQRRGSIIF